MKNRVDYQGKEFTTVIQANTLRKLNTMIKGLKSYAHEHEMDDFRVLSKEKDPDGGYRAVIQAHNWNPIAWVKEKWEKRGGGPEVRLSKEKARKRAAIKAAPVLARERTRLEIAEAKAKKPRLRTQGPTDLEYRIFRELKSEYPEVYENFWTKGITIQDLIASFREAMPVLYDKLQRST